MQTVEDKLAQLAELAENLKEQEALALEEAKKCDTEDEPEGSEGKSEIETDDIEDSDAKPDFIDADKDGDKKEDMVKALKDKKQVKESEGLDELSQGTLKSYKQGALDDGRLGMIKNDKAKMAKRSAGMKVADSKIKTESEETHMDLGNLFEGQELSEEFKANATELFEAAVALRVEQEVAALTAELQEGFEQKALEESTELKESLVDKVDGYLDYMVEQWMEKNELAINRGIKTEILESFVSGMKEVFESHYIDVPDEKYDLVEAAQTEVQDLEARLDEAVAKTVELTGTLKEISRQIMIDEAVEGLVETDAEKFRALAEELTYSDEGFDRKLAMIKESYFSKSTKPSVVPLVEEFMTDTPVAELNEVAPKIDPVMAQYLTAIERSTY